MDVMMLPEDRFPCHECGALLDTDFYADNGCPMCGHKPKFCPRCYGFIHGHRCEDCDYDRLEDFPHCPECDGAIAEDGQCQDCLRVYPEHKTEDSNNEYVLSAESVQGSKRPEHDPEIQTLQERRIACI